MNLLKAASTVSLLTLASRITGLIREQLIAAHFGASAATDAFNVAFRIPNLLRRLFGEGAFSQAFVPILAATRETEGDTATQHLIDAVGTVLVWALALTCVIGMVGAPLIVWAMASGLERFDLAAQMTRWMFPYIAFISLVALSAGVLNTWKHFAVPAITPVLLNLSVIFAAWWVAPRFAANDWPPVYALACGVMVGGVLQLAIQVPALKRIGHVPRLGWTPAALRGAWHHPGVRRVLAQMLPALIGVSVAQISVVINTQIASHLGAGAVSWLTYADRLMEFPTALLGVALGVVLIPQLSAMRARGDSAAYSGHLDWGLRLSLILAAPCAVALLVFPEAMVAVLYHYGRFADHDVYMTVSALRGYGVGLMGLVGVKVLAPGFFARQDLRTPVRIAVVVLVCTQLLNLVLVPRLGHAGLALSIGLGALINASWLGVSLYAKGLYAPEPGWLAFLVKVALACLVVGVALGFAQQHLDWLGLRSHWAWRAGCLAASLAIAAGLYFAALGLMGLRLHQFARRG
jgi:putative peptidoglycan lipid II flippase